MAPKKIPPRPVAFFLEMVPIPAGNAHKVSARGPKCSRCRKRRYTSIVRTERAERHIHQIRLLATAHAPRIPWTGPVAFTLEVVYVPPPSWPAWKRECALAGLIEPTSKNDGDRDNLHKGVADALEGLFFKDDGQVTRGPIRKRYGERSGYQVSVVYRPLPPANAAEGRAALKALQEQTAELEPHAPILTEDDAFDQTLLFDD